MEKLKRPFLETVHKWVFGFDAEIQIHGWSWKYWVDADHENISPCGGNYISVTDGIFCFQRKYAV